jgi:hypothetical protein
MLFVTFECKTWYILFSQIIQVGPRIGLCIGHDRILPYLLTPWRYSSCRTMDASHILCKVSWRQIFYTVGPSAPRPASNPEDQDISLSLAPPSKPVRHGWTYQQLCFRLHSFTVYCCTQAPHPATKCFRQGGVTIEGAHYFISIPI